MEKKKNITKNMYFESFLYYVTYKDAEIHGKNPIFVKLKDITENVYLECFLSSFSTKKLKTQK